MATYYTQPEIIDRARLLAIGAGGDPHSSPLNDNDFIAEVLYPHVVKNVFLREAKRGNSDIRARQTVTMVDGTVELPANVMNLDNMFVYVTPQTVSAVTWVSATDVITATAHQFWTGLPVVFTTDAATLGGGLTAGTTYYVIRITASTFKIALSVADALANIPIDIDGDTQGTVVVTPSYIQGSFSYVPRFMDYVRTLPTVFNYWNVNQGSFNVRLAGSSNITDFDGDVALDGPVFPRPMRKWQMLSADAASETFTLTDNGVPMDEFRDGDRVRLTATPGATLPAELSLNAYYFVNNWDSITREFQLCASYAATVTDSVIAFSATPFVGTFYFTHHDLSVFPNTPAPQDLVEDVIMELAKAMRGEPPYQELGNEEKE